MMPVTGTYRCLHLGGTHNRIFQFIVKRRITWYNVETFWTRAIWTSLCSTSIAKPSSVISNSRKYFLTSVLSFDVKIQQIPYTFIIWLLKFISFWSIGLYLNLKFCRCSQNCVILDWISCLQFSNKKIIWQWTYLTYKPRLQQHK